MNFLKLAFCAPLLVLPVLPAYAETTDQKIDRLEAQIHKLKIKKPANELATAQVIPALPAAPYYSAPVNKIPYSWTGVYVGAYGGVVTDDRETKFLLPNTPNLQGNDIGFNGNNVDSQNYNALANGTNSNANQPGTLNGPFAPGYTSYSQTAFAQGYNTNVGNTAVGLNPAVASNNGPVVGVNANVNVTPYNNLPGDRSDSMLTQKDNSRRLLGMLGGEVGYRKQFGLFVLGVEADGGIIDGKRNSTANTTGQFSNNQGANGTAQAGECFGGNGAGGCGSAGINNSIGNVNVANNGNSSFSQSVTAGPQWLGTARVTAGVAVDRVLLYATGGLAYGQSDLAVSATYRDVSNSVCSGTPSSFTNGSVAGSTSVNYACNGVGNTGSSNTYSNAASWSGYRSKFMTGVAVGGGAAFAVTDNVTLKLEGVYYNLGSISTTAVGSGSTTLTTNAGAAPIGSTPGTRAASVTPFSVNRTIDGFIAKMGVQVKFDTAPPVGVVAPVIAARY